MVYKGKPSEGCGVCRKRRIKCDLQRPACGQCLKSRRECFGYRDQVDLMFVDQTGAVEAKASGKRSKETSSRGSSPNDENYNDAGEMSIQLLPQTIPETTERLAWGFFFSEFLTMPRYEDASRGHLEYIFPFCTSARADSPLVDATAAVALASFAAKRPNQKIRMQASTYYAKAIAMLQEAIADPELSRSNDTLMAIMVLGFFESLVADSSTVAEWGHHSDGALAMVRYRGDEMLHDPVSRKLFWATQTQAVYSNIIKNVPLEPFLDWERLWDEPMALPDGNTAIKLTAITSRVPCLRAGALKWLQQPMSGEVALKCVDLIGHAKVLDQLIAGWLFEAPAFWKPRIVGTIEGHLDSPETTELYPGNVEVYADLWVGNIINAWRITRAACQMIIVNCLERLYRREQLESVPEFRAAVALIQEMANGLCASVPYHMGHSLPSFDVSTFEPSFFTWPTSPAATEASSMESASPASSHDSTDSKLEKSVVGALGGHYLILPLFFMYPTPTLPDDQRRWMAGRLSHVGKVYGSGQATTLANLCPRTNDKGRPMTNADFAPPPFVSYPDVYSILTSTEYRDEEALRDLQPLTAEARLFRAWRKDFLQRLIDL